MASFLHAGDLGDIIYALPTIKHLGGGRLYLTTKPGTREQMTPARFEFIRPLLLAQDYIESVEMHHGQKITHDFTGFREGYVPKVTLAEMQRRHVQPLGPRPDFAKPWLTAPIVNPSGRAVVARSARYRNPEWDQVWPTIFRLEGDPIFLGTKEEHADFVQRFGDIEHRPTSTARDMADVIAASSIFVGNQSLPYAIAEGLKHKRALEVYPKALDCLYSGGEVTHVLKASDWPEAGKPVLMLALQFCPIDQIEALELAELIADLEPVKRDDVEFSVCVRDDTAEEFTETVAAVLRSKFKRVHVLRSRRAGRGWPDGCNDLWQSTMVELGKMARAHTTKAEAVFTFEPDCIPASRNWIDLLVAEWSRTRRQGKLAFGHVHEYRHGRMHMNGNMVLDIHATKLFPELQTSSGSWDTTHARLFCEQGIDSKLIRNFYNQRDISAEEVKRIIKATPGIAIIHGIKTAAGREAVREGRLA